MRVLVVCAHPDDETFGMGGTIALHADRGDNITMAILTEGASARFPSKSKAKDAILHLRKCARRAASILGVSEVLFADFPDMKLDTVPGLQICRFLEAQVARIRPEVLYTPHRADLNQDHRIAYEASMVATRPVKGMSVRRVVSYEIGSSSEWGPLPASDNFRPNVFVDISKSLERKLRAAEAYDTELREYPHPRSPGAVEVRAKYRGTNVGYEHAEAFELIRELDEFWVKNLRRSC